MAESSNGSSVRNFIDGQFLEPGGAEHTLVFDPALGEPIAEARNSTPSDVDDAVAAARRAGADWAAHTAGERADLLLQLSNAIAEHADELALIEQRNGGKPAHVAAEEPKAAIEGLRFYAGAARVMEGTAAGEYVRGNTSMLRRDPIGTVGCIVPWNYPLSTAVAKFAPALAAGNTVVVKPSELTPLSMMRLCELAAEILPAGVLNVAVGTGETVGAQIAAHPDVAMISMTGSPRAGKAIAAAAAPTLKRLHLELGGNAPVIVFPDADVAALAETLRFAAFWNSGQECGAAARVLVHRDAVGDVRDALAALVETIVVGAPAEPDVDIGPVISSAQRDRIRGLIDGATRAGATVVTGQAGPDGDGFYVSPMLVTGVEQSSTIVQQESFGPLLTLQTFADEAEAVALANGTTYALSGSIWGADVTRGLRLARHLTCGTTWLNTHLLYSSELPWGGTGDSGGGRDNSLYALEDHTITRHVMVALGEA